MTPAPVAADRPDLSDETFLLELKPLTDPYCRTHGIRRTPIYRLKRLLKYAARGCGFDVRWGRESATIPLASDHETGGNMVRFTDGPAAGVTLMLRRAPLYLRVVYNPETKKWDALDQLTDQAAAGEQIIVYRRTGEAGVCFLDWTEKGKRRGGRFSTACYAVVEQQPPDDVLRDKAKWQAWCWSVFNASKAQGVA